MPIFAKAYSEVTDNIFGTIFVLGVTEKYHLRPLRTMKELRFILASILLSIGGAGCSTAFFAADSNAYVDDLYAPHDRAQIARRKQAEAEVARLEAEALKSQWEALLAEAEAASAQTRYENYTYSNVLADTYESAYARRLRGFQSPTYRMPSSYYDLRYSPAYHYVTAYDPMNYNIVVMGDQVWVEPKYISSMFGAWGAPSFAVYSGWGRPYYGWNYASWGYPHYSWWDWNYDWSWNFGWGWGWHHGPGWSRPLPPAPSGNRPAHYANYRPWGGSSGYRGTPTVNRSSPYTSPRPGNYRGTGATGNYRGTPAGTSDGRGSATGTSPRNGTTNYRSNDTRREQTTPSDNRNTNYRPSGNSSGSYRSSGSGSGYRSGGGSSGSRGGGNYRR